MSMTEDIRRAAFNFGFDRVAITDARRFDATHAVFADRVERGLFDGMDWMTVERARRASTPTDHVPTARSIISLSTSYLFDNPEDLTRPGDPHGRVARYAWGTDYHGYIAERTRQLCRYLQEVHGAIAQPKACVDTVALAERAVAQRAGLGWFGKNTMLLTESHGSWVFLSEIITDLELEPDTPLRKSCGSCRRCGDACPTGALDVPYELDARLCISFLTIELKGAIPRHLRARMGTWIFGCDICQEVCPVNRKVRQANQANFEGDGGLGPSPALLPLLELDDAGFSARFRHSPARRAKRAGLLRNVCVALGNHGDPVAIRPLGNRLLTDPSPLIRQHAAWALGRFDEPTARQSLEQAWGIEIDTDVRTEIEAALLDTA